MTNQDLQLAAVAVALNNIHAELKILNQNIARLGNTSSAAPRAPYAPRPAASSESTGEFAPKRTFRPGTKPPMRSGVKSGPRASSTSRSSASSPPRKKGDGYPKKPR